MTTKPRSKYTPKRMPRRSCPPDLSRFLERQQARVRYQCERMVVRIYHRQVEAGCTGEVLEIRK